MLEGKLEALIPVESVAAFRRMWESNGDDALADFQRVLEIFSEPQDHDEIRLFVARLVMGLVAGKPDAGSWLEAIAVGSFALRPEQDYASSKELKSRARFLDRRKGLFLGNIEEHRRAWAAEVEEAQDAVRLLLISMVLKELRKNVAAKAALGPAWPLMVAVNDHFEVTEKRALYFYGADNRLQLMLAEGIREAIENFTELYTDPTATLPETADWRRAIPPGADVHKYFDGKEEAVAPGAAATPCQTINNATVPIPDNGEERSFSYMTLPDGSPRPIVAHDETSKRRLRAMMPLLTTGNRDEEMLALAARAHARHMWGPKHILGKFDHDLAGEIREWVRRGYSPPQELRPEHAHLFEEEACLARFEEPSVLRSWQELRFFPYLPDANPQATMPMLEEWLDAFIRGKCQ